MPTVNIRWLAFLCEKSKQRENYTLGAVSSEIGG